MTLGAGTVLFCQISDTLLPCCVMARTGAVSMQHQSPPIFQHANANIGQGSIVLVSFFLILVHSTKATELPINNFEI